MNKIWRLSGDFLATGHQICGSTSYRQDFWEILQTLIYPNLNTGFSSILYSLNFVYCLDTAGGTINFNPGWGLAPLFLC